METPASGRLQTVVVAVVVDEWPDLIPDAQPCHLAKKHTVRGHVLGLQDAAVEDGERIDEGGRASRDRIPLALCESLFLRQFPEPRKGIRQLLVVVAER